jgi:hypothetical protein
LVFIYTGLTFRCGSNAAEWLVTPEVPMVIMPERGRKQGHRSVR